MPTHSLLTPRLAATIVSRVAKGIPIETVASQLGLGKVTIWSWIGDPDRFQADDVRTLAHRLVKGIAHARAHREWHTLQRIERIASRDDHRDQLKALTWTLERHPAYRDRYGLKVQMQHTSSLPARREAELASLGDNELEAIVSGEFRELPSGQESPP